MKHTPRLFSCVYCHTQTIICSHCDRGQIYCSPTCSHSARKKSCNEAKKRYQNTFKGKMKHALRQKSYRARLKEKVTDQGSPITPLDGLLKSDKNKTTEPQKKHDDATIRCAFCKKTLSSWLRHRFLRYHLPKSVPKLSYLKPP
jgi:hypothetical protein